MTHADTSSETDHLEMRLRINTKCMNTPAQTPLVDTIREEIIEPGFARKTPLRIYSPASKGLSPLIVFIHGGAWVAGSLDTHDNLARYLCKNTQSVVVSVGYQNSPEAVFPSPLEECYDALVWASKHVDTLQCAPDSIAIAGDSAGGNMAAAVCHMARDRKGPKIAFQALINPVSDLTCNGTLKPQGDALDTLRSYARMYVKDPNDVHNPYVSPLLSQTFSGIPPALVLLAEEDEFYENGRAYAEKMQQCGVHVNTYCQQGIGHLGANGARAAESALESLDIACVALKNAFRRSRR